jgi:hypothetical protein
MIVMAFDLSSVCIGVTFGQIDSQTKKITYGKTLPIIPKRLDPRDYGYTTKDPKKIAFKGKEFKGFLKEGEFSISNEEAKKRTAHLKSSQHNFLLRSIGKQCGHFLAQIKPDVVSMEKNMSFNGILTTKLLAEIAGGLYFYCGSQNIPLFDYNEATVRARIRRDITEFSYEKDGLVALDTKWEIYCRLRAYFNEMDPTLFNFEKMTMDESDSLAVFYYYYVTEILKN